MALLNTQLDRAALRAMVRRELLDTGTRWWTNDELNQYIEDWQTDLQDRFEFVWGTATVTATSTIFSTMVLSGAAPDMLRNDAIYFNKKRLVGRTQEDLDILNREWRNAPSGTPVAVFELDSTNIGFHPVISDDGTLVFEYPRKLSFANDAATMSIPAWTKYSVKHFAAWKAYLRAGPNQDINRAMARKARYLSRVNRYQTIYSNFYPDRALRLKLPPLTYEADILTPIASNYPTLP